METKIKKPEGIRTWVEIDQNALKHNFSQFKKIIKPSCKMLAVVKSNAYGHGLVGCSKLFESFGADFLGVDSIMEALTLRREGIKIPILVLGYTLPENIEAAIENNISITVSSVESLEKILRFALNSQDGALLKIHLKIDTGMHRQGFYPEELLEAIKLIKQNKNIEIEGVFTHFCSAKNPSFPATTNQQISEFEKALSILGKAGYEKIIRHAAATGGTVLFPKAHYDMVRIGIGLYGLWPSLETKAVAKDRIELRPALTWKSIISEIKTVPAGGGIGYDQTEICSVPTKIAIIPVGYWHGYRRDLSSVGRVKIGEKFAKILGRVSMDMIAIDISGIKNPKVDEEALLISGTSQDCNSAENLAILIDKSWYEVITQLNPLMKRIYRD